MRNVLGRIRLRTGLAIVLVVLVVASMLLNVAWMSRTQEKQSEREMLETASLLAQQMSATWDFIDINQDVIDTDSDGTYNFKGIYCAIAGKSIGKLFSKETGYTIRYVSANPRRVTATPDDFERAALEAFDAGEVEHYAITSYQEEDVFRYVTPLRITYSCLQCHGEPEGEIDVTGFPKEGYRIGDVSGAISIIMPADLYLENNESMVRQQSIYFLVVLLLLVGAIYVAMHFFVSRPLGALTEAVKSIDGKDVHVNAGDVVGTSEIRELAERFRLMELRLQEFYDGLEKQVESRTEELAEANRVLANQSEQLEETIRQLALTNDLLEKKSRHQSDFLAIMSHELRTPLTSILAFTDIWEAACRGRDEGEVMAVREIKESAQHLLHMVNNILEVARFEAKGSELILEPIDMVDVLAAARASVGFLAEKKSVELKLSVANNVPIILSDCEKLRRIIENLISNAVKFTEEGGMVLVDVGYDEFEGNVAIRVSDDGIGIREEQMDAIFDRFSQADQSTRRRYGGSGLGLTVVKELSEALGGEVSVKSVYGEGSVFTVLLPVRILEEAEV